MSSVPTCDILMRLSDLRSEEALSGREDKLRAEADRIGWPVYRVVLENDMVPGKDGKLKPKPASAFKRRRVRNRDGSWAQTEAGGPVYRVLRPAFQEVLADINAGRANAVLAEDLDRVCRDPRDLEDLIDVCELRKASARSISGSLTLTGGGTDSEIFMARMMVNVANKSSRDTARRVADAKARLHGDSYCGGPRPYGFVPAQDTAEYHKTLIIVPDEAEVLRTAAGDILDKGVTVMAAARDLRDRGVPTAKGDTKWSAHALKRVLLKPAVAGLAAHKGELKPAPWPAIIEPDVWEKLTATLTDPARRTNGVNGNEPRWLLSGLALCGICADGSTVTATGNGGHGGPSYVCGNGWHLRRNARLADDYVERIIVARLSQPDVKDILRPPVRPGIDTGSLREEIKRLRKAKAAQIHAHAAGDIDDADLATGMRDIRDRLTVAEGQLRSCDAPDPLAEFRDRPAAAVWASLSLARKRSVVRLLMTVTILPTERRGRGLDPDSVVIEPNA